MPEQTRKRRSCHVASATRFKNVTFVVFRRTENLYDQGKKNIKVGLDTAKNHRYHVFTAISSHIVVLSSHDPAHCLSPTLYRTALVVLSMAFTAACPASCPFTFHSSKSPYLLAPSRPLVVRVGRGNPGHSSLVDLTHSARGKRFGRSGGTERRAAGRPQLSHGLCAHAKGLVRAGRRSASHDADGLCTSKHAGRRYALRISPGGSTQPVPHLPAPPCRSPVASASPPGRRSPGTRSQTATGSAL
jgi:hypothetical protein